MSKIVWLIVIAWVVRAVFSAFKKAIAQAKAEIAAEKARQEAPQAEAEAQSQPAPTTPQAEDPRAALIRMLKSAGVSPSIAKVVESAIDYDDDARENKTDYDDTSDEDATDYDDDARENKTDFDDDSDEDATDYDDKAPAPPVVYAAPPPPVVYATPDDATSSAVNLTVRADIASHVQPTRALPKLHGLDGANIHSMALVRDSVVLDVLMRRYPGNPFFMKRR